MIKSDANQVFFSALAQVSSEVTGPESVLTLAVQEVTNNPCPTGFVRTQEELARLPDDLRDQILGEVHARLRNDIGLIWENLPCAPASGRPN